MSGAFDESFGFGFDVGELAPPENVLAVHIGSGAVMLTWEEPADTQQPDYYEVWGCSSLNGTYYLYMNGKFTIKRGVVYNVPVGITAFFRVRSRNAAGLVSDFVQAQAALAQQPLVAMSVTSIEGSIIPSGAIFSIQDDGGRLIAVSANSQITV